MQAFFAGEQHLFRFYAFRVGDAAIYRADGGALGFFMESFTLGTFVGDDKVEVVGDRRIFVFSVNYFAIFECIRAFYGIVAISDGPLYPAFIDSVVRTFRFTCTTVDAFVSDHNCHSN